MDIEKLKPVLAQATDKGLDQHELAVKARHLCYAASKEEIVDAQLKHFVVRSLLSRCQSLRSVRNRRLVAATSSPRSSNKPRISKWVSRHQPCFKHLG